MHDGRGNEKSDLSAAHTEVHFDARCGGSQFLFLVYNPFAFSRFVTSEKAVKHLRFLYLSIAASIFTDSPFVFISGITFGNKILFSDQKKKSPLHREACGRYAATTSLLPV